VVISGATCWRKLSCANLSAWAAVAGSEPETGRNLGRSLRGRGFDHLRNAGRTPERCWRS
jgi:hypothetical protein